MPFDLHIASLAGQKSKSGNAKLILKLHLKSYL